MHSFAAVNAPVAAPAIPLEWITSGMVSPVSPGVASPAASVPTGWSPQPAMVAADGGNTSMLDALAATILGDAPAPTAAPAYVQAQTPPMVAAPVAQPAVQVPAYVPAPVQVVAAPPVSPVAAGAAAAPQDPTLVGSVATAISGFASATGRAIGDVAGAGVSKARRVGTEMWAGVRSPRSIHVSQVPSKYNAAPAAGNKDCGPASVVMTLKLLGKSIPGAAGSAAPQKLINRVRQLAGNVANTAATTNHELGRALRAAGAKTREIADAASIRQAILAGKPVILNGNPRNPGAYGSNFSAKQMTPYNGAHWVVVSGMDQKTGKFIINDPLSKVGPVQVTPSQLEAYRAGSLGIEVQG